MADHINQYREEMDAKRIIQIREITRGLPQACSDFLRSIAISTSTLTRLAYAIDLTTFFRFLHDERISFSQKDLIFLDDEDLEKLSRSDIVAYMCPYQTTKAGLLLLHWFPTSQALCPSPLRAKIRFLYPWDFVPGSCQGGGQWQLFPAF